MEQLNSLFTLRHCGRALRLREHPVRLRADGPLPVAVPRTTSTPTSTAAGWTRRSRSSPATATAARRCWPTSSAEMRQASAEQRYERAAWLRRRLRAPARCSRPTSRALRAIHARPRLVVAPHPRRRRRRDAFWLVGGRLVDWGPVQPGDGGDVPRAIGARRRCVRRRPRARRLAARPTRSTRCGSSRRTSPRTTCPASIWPPIRAERLGAFADSATAAAVRLTPDSPLSCRSDLKSCGIYCTVLQTLGHGRPASRFPKAPSRPREGGSNGSSATVAVTSPSPTAQHVAGARLAAHERQRRPRRARASRRRCRAARPRARRGTAAAPAGRARSAAGRAGGGSACPSSAAARPSPGRRSSPS